MLVLLEPERPQQRKGWRAFYIDFRTLELTNIKKRSRNRAI